MVIYILKNNCKTESEATFNLKWSGDETYAMTIEAKARLVSVKRRKGGEQDSENMEEM